MVSVNATKGNSIIFTSPANIVRQRGVRSEPGVLLHPTTTKAIKIIKAIFAGKHQNQVKRVSEGFQITDYRLYNQIAKAANFITQEASIARLDLIETLIQLDYRVGLMVPDPQTGFFPEEDFIEEAIAKGLPETNIYPTMADSSNIFWPRNLFIQVDANVFSGNHINPDLLFGLGLPKNRFFSNAYGDGGTTILCRNVALITSTIGLMRWADPTSATEDAERLKLIQEIWIKQLMNQGYQTVCSLNPPLRDVLPAWFLNKIGIEARIFAPSVDIDYVMFSSPEDNLIAFHGDFAERNQQFIKDLKVDQPDLKVVVLSKGNHLHANSIGLPGGGVLMDAGAKKDKQTIKKTGVEVFTTKEAHDNYGQPGGLRCATNVLTIPD